MQESGKMLRREKDHFTWLTELSKAQHSTCGKMHRTAQLMNFQVIYCVASTHSHWILELHICSIQFVRNHFINGTGTESQAG